MAAQAAIEATLSLLAAHGVTGSQVERVHCEVTPFVQDCLTYARPRTVAEAQFSMPFAISCTLAHGAPDLDCLTPERLLGPSLEQAMAKIEMIPCAALQRAGEEGHDQLEAARVTLQLADGRAIGKHVPVASGMLANPVSDARLQQKFRACAARALGGGEAAALLHRIARLRELPSATLLFH